RTARAPQDEAELRPLVRCPSFSKRFSTCKKSGEVLDHLLRHLFLDVMAARERLVRDDARCIPPPNIEELLGAFGWVAACAPKEQQRHINLCILVGGVHGEVAGRGGTIIAA